MTEFLARFSARRPLLVLTLWAVLTLVAGAISIKLLDSATTTELKLTGGAESEIAGRLLEERLRGPEPLIELVVVQSDDVTVDDPEFEAKVQSVFESIVLVSLGGGAVTAGRSYYQDDDESLVSADRSATIIQVVLAGTLDEAEDVFDIFGKYTPIVFVFVLGCSFIILMLVFRSIVIPIKAVVMNLLSVGTAYGLLVLVFQKGYGAEFLGFQQVEVIDTWIPLFLFSILFGLSMDYHGTTTFFC